MSKHDVQKCEKHGVELIASPSGLVCLKCAENHVNELRAGSEQSGTNIVKQSRLDSKRQQQGKRFDRIGIPPRFRRRSFANYQAETPKQQQALKMVKHYAKGLHDGRVMGGLVLLGNVGNGKTHLACAVANAYEAQGKNVLFINVAGMIRKIRESYRQDAVMTEAQAIALFRDYDLLVLDEVGVQKGDEKEINLITEVVDQRYGWEKPTILLSNLKFADFEALLQARIVDRLKEDGGMVVTFDWDSFRSHAGGVHRQQVVS